MSLHEDSIWNELELAKERIADLESCNASLQHQADQGANCKMKLKIALEYRDRYFDATETISITLNELTLAQIRVSDLEEALTAMEADRDMWRQKHAEAIKVNYDCNMEIADLQVIADANADQCLRMREELEASDYLLTTTQGLLATEKMSAANRQEISDKYEDRYFDASNRIAELEVRLSRYREALNRISKTTCTFCKDIATEALEAL